MVRINKDAVGEGCVKNVDEATVVDDENYIGNTEAV